MKFENEVCIARALAPFAEAGTVLKVLLRCDQFPPKTVHRRLQFVSNIPVKEFIATRLPSHGNQLTRKCCDPNGTSVTASSALVDAVGLAGGSNACVPRQPFVQPGTSRALAMIRVDGCAGSNGFRGVVKLVNVNDAAGFVGFSCNAYAHGVVGRNSNSSKPSPSGSGVRTVQFSPTAS